MNFIEFNKITLSTILYAVVFCAAAVLAAFSYPELALYFLLNYVIYAIIVAVLVEGWKSSGKVLVESNKEKWVTYVYGIPVEENRSTLRNLHFSSLKSMRGTYLFLLVLKASIPLCLLYGFVMRIIHLEAENIDITLVAISALCICFFAVRIYVTSRAIIVAYRNQWVVDYNDKDEVTYGSAYIKNESKYVPFLEEVFR